MKKKKKEKLGKRILKKLERMIQSIVYLFIGLG